MDILQYLIILIYITGQSRLNLIIFVYLLSRKMLFNIFLLVFRTEILLSKTGFKIWSFFAFLNDVGFDAINFIEPGDLIHYN